MRRVPVQGGFWAVLLLGSVALHGCTKTQPTGTEVGPASQLGFVGEPSNAAAGAAIKPAVQVVVEDAHGNIVTTATTSITMAIGTNPAGGTLAGTTTMPAVNGVATFANLSINNPGNGYTLTASAATLTAATSGSFNILAPPPRLSAGAEQACGVTTSGAAYCWGLNNDGQLGNGSFTNGTTPVAVSGGLSFTTVGTGSEATCGVTTSGAVYCWGDNSQGELGNGSTNSSATPVAVSGLPPFATVAVTAGALTACSLTISEAAYCWGYNGGGQLGNGSLTNSPAPVAVSGGLSFATVVVSTGDYFTCGVTTSGVAYCWGDNSNGQLGNGSNSASTTPIAVSGGLSFATVDAGENSATCGVTTSGAAYCWGFGGNGGLGNGSTSNSGAPVAVSGGLSFATVSAGQVHTCAVTISGAAYCWGDNSAGELGNGSTTRSPSPVAVSGGLSFAAVSAGDAYTCGLTIDGAAYCWGNNAYGQLGNNSTTNSSTPVAVSGGLSFPISQRVRH